ncbi:DNA adenine methylase [Providencia sp. PROV236]|uniref:DNA adenine methylase n=1 Tax=Providencia sp. PROV236 TaxID=2936798 RepID=UPI0034E1D40B
MTTIKHPAIRYHGGKFRLAPWVISHFPDHRCYVEPFGGAASVLLRKPRSEAEVYNDLDDEIVNLFRVLRDKDQAEKLIDACLLTPYSRTEFNCAYDVSGCPIERARKTIVRATMGFGSAGATKGKTGFRLDTKRNSATAQKIWTRAPENLLAVVERMQGVLIENRDAVQCMKDHDTASTLHFIDPPYLHETRSMRSETYRYEMNEWGHQQLITVAGQLSGKVIICGYDNDLYNGQLSGWRKEAKTTAANGHAGSVKRTECLWLNF